MPACALYIHLYPSCSVNCTHQLMSAVVYPKKLKESSHQPMMYWVQLYMNNVADYFDLQRKIKFCNCQLSLVMRVNH